MTSKKPEIIGNFEFIENKGEGKLRTRREVLLMGAIAATGAIATSTGIVKAAETESKAAGVIAGAAPAAGGKSYTAKD